MADISQIKTPNGTTYNIKATKLTTSTAGSSSQPCYFANGVPVACTVTFAKKAIIAVPAGNANTAITITHNLGITGTTIGSSTVYAATVQVFETSSNTQVVCDVKLVNANSISLTFSSAVTANAYYVVITY